MKHDSHAKPLYLEDIAPGDEFRSAEHRIDAAQIIEYARQFDPQPFHIDEDAAQDTFFRGLAASGWHTASITMRLLIDSLPFARGVIGAGGEIWWPRPTRPGDVLHVRSTVLEITPSRSKPDQALVKVENLTVNQEGEVCQKLIANLLVFRRPD
ncbi:MaoC family dehydratase [Lysobacter sp. GX 14042]|uniref:MaoC family dehydratase n=1 Tax=Lysobacter sp. GX 14042 TaxID=2907155 RepID=UPI001F3023D1|nr:MaoC family dehydratase [Lysobacter sp. GX 14042]MCE7031445.1 MaoC family dehydratase [Lysobacter sp. GX 14042]